MRRRRSAIAAVLAPVLRLAVALSTGLPVVAARLLAQEATPPKPAEVEVKPGWDPAQVQPYRPTLTFTLSRALTAGDGRLAVLLDAVDLSALVVQRGTALTLSLAREALPDGPLSVAVYLVGTDGIWRERGTFALRRRTRAGLDSAGWQPRLAAQSEGQLAQGGVPSGPGARPLPFQDLAWNGGLAGIARRGTWRADWQSLLVANARQPLRLRASRLGAEAPVVDLASYSVRLSHRRGELTAGHVQVGNDRLLANQFRSRGLRAEASLGQRAEVTMASVSGSELVGWDDPAGLARPSHRVQLASMALEALPKQPGLLRAELTAIDGSLQPLPAFSQQAVTDRERSRGLGATLAAALPSQRARLTLGMARSRFTNPVDPLLSGTASIIPVDETARWAQFADVAVEALRQRAVFGVVTSLQLAARHQRTDPLYRSVAAFVQADQRQDALDATAAFGPVQWQGSVSQGRDNVGNLANLLTTRSRTRSTSTTVPVATVFGRPTAWWLPTLTASWQGSGQVGDPPPDSAGFRSPVQRPDQWNTNALVSAAWQRKWLQATWRVNRSFVDNRQEGRESSDFRSAVQAITLNAAPSPQWSVGVDLSDERQHAVETQTRAHSRRVALQGDWRPFASTALNGAWSTIIADDRAATRRGRNDEFRAELSQVLRLRRSPTAPELRVFARIARTRVFTRLGDLLERSTPQRVVSAGASARIF
jgi:hypothetical protein